MANKTRISSDDLQVGQSIPWHVYDGGGTLLLRKGHIIESQRQLDRLIQRGLFRDGASKEADQNKKQTEVNPFTYMTECTRRLSRLFGDIRMKQKGVSTRLTHFVQELRGVLTHNRDAALATVHLLNDVEYIYIHPLHQAILCDLMAETLKYTQARHEALLAAALTANIAMLNEQSRLFKQQHPPDENQKKAIRAHPEEGIELLKTAGITDKLLLDIVLQHHERIDGSGYHGLKDDSILEEAKILGLSDVYCAMVSPRRHRSPLSPNESLKRLFIDKGRQYDENLAVLFIKMMGVYPPGVFVQLVNGEIAIVVKRPAAHRKWPIVAALINAKGGGFIKAVYRDCNQPEFAIKASYQPKKSLPINFTQIWDYKS